MSLALTHAKYHFLETVRVPIAVIGTMFFPAASMLFFVVPFAGSHSAAASYATGAMTVFATMSACLFQYGISVAEDRAQPWEPFTRTLPVGAAPRFIGRVINVGVMTLLALLPVLLIAALLTEATVSVPGLLLGAVALLVTAVPFSLLGLTVGYALPSRAALAVTQLLFFPMAFGGGLFFGGPDRMPSFLEHVAPFLPTRGAVELVWTATTDFSPEPTSLIALGVWTAATAGTAVWAFRRDQGRRFR